MYTDVESSIIYNSQKVGKKQMAINWQGMLLGHKKEWNTDTCHKVKKPQNVTLCEKRQSQKFTYYMIPFIEMSRVGKFVETENRWVVAGVVTS